MIRRDFVRLAVPLLAARLRPALTSLAHPRGPLIERIQVDAGVSNGAGGPPRRPSCLFGAPRR